ncbi:hypothetical protein TIFTF001_044193 [Ficus carica]|uniref:Putative plant transposon protein domain-containing protein n=1 Tax=Ficus carica TaxID=3494 RepID=A0AA88CN72_FICCA|nr:hypothetical protein TIFTF001_044193 [Ficus carica]
MPVATRTRRGRREPVRAEPESSESEPEQSLERVERFRSADAIDRFQSCTNQRALYMERGFIFKPNTKAEYPKFVHNVIAEHQWRNFCRPQSAAVIQLVREFYANYDPAVPNSIFVRGKHVPLTPEAINHIYALPEVEDQYQEFFNSIDANELKEVLNRLCEEGAEWTRGKRGAMTFPRAFLKPGPKVWFHFLKFKLMPSSHDHLINKERAILLHCIMEGRNFDVGKLIQKQIGVCARRNSGGLWFPSLITQLCATHDVIIETHEPKEQPAAQITPMSLTRILQEDNEPEAAAPNAPRLAAPNSSASERPNPDLVAGFLRMEQRLSQIEVMQYEHMQHMRDFWRYERERDLTLQKHFRANSNRFQSFPKFPSHLCDSPPEDTAQDSPEEAAGGPSSTSGPKQLEHADAATSKQSEKGKTVAAEPSSRRHSLRSTVNWKWQS